jgi:hypothetical protein
MPTGDLNQDRRARIAERRRLGRYKDPTRMASFMRGLGQGATLSTADEIFGTLGAVPEMLVAAFDRDPSTTMRGAMGEGIEGYRAKDEAAMDAYGGSFLAGEVLGTAAPLAAATLTTGGGATPAVTAAATANRANRVRQLAQSGVKAFSTRAGPVTGGAAYGAAEGFGSSEGNLVERLPGTAVGTVFGAGAGKGADVSLGALGNIGTNLMNITGARAPMSRLPIVGGMFDSLEDLSERQIRESLPTGDDLTKAIDDLETYPEQMVLDIRGPDEIAREVQIPGTQGRQVTDALYERRAGQEDRIVESLVEAVTKGGDRPNVIDVTEAIAKTQRTAAKPFYEKAYEATVPKSILDDHMKMPEFQKAYKKAQELWVARGEEGVMPAFDELGDDVPLMMMDYVKRGLDDVLQVGRRGGGDSGIGGGINRAAIDRKNQMLAELDELVPAYRQARAIWAGGEAAQDAMSAGRDAFKPSVTADVAEAEFRKLTPGERKHWRIGATDQLLSLIEKMRQSLDTSGGGQIGGIFQSTAGQRKIKLLFDDDEVAEAFINYMKQENLQHITSRKTLDLSPTASRQVVQGQLGEVVGTTSTGTTMLDVLKGAFNTLREGGRKTTMEKKSDIMGPMLVTKGKEGAELVRRLVKDRDAPPPVTSLVRRAGSRSAATQAADRGPTEAERRRRRLNRLRMGGR